MKKVTLKLKVFFNHDAIAVPEYATVSLDQGLIKLIDELSRVVDEHKLNRVAKYSCDVTMFEAEDEDLGEMAIATECDEMEVDATYVRWTAYPKHHDHRAQTQDVNALRLASLFIVHEHGEVIDLRGEA